jgi:prepilin-type processing-associated H-X9-DG protein
MKLRITNPRKLALTFVEVLVVFVCLAILIAAILMPLRTALNRRSASLACISNVKQISLAYRICENDNPQEQISFTPATNENAALLNPGQKVWLNFISHSVSNNLTWAKILRCPFDTKPSVITDSAGNKIEISYFLCPDASETYPQMILSGDDNLADNDVPVKSGFLDIIDPNTISWTKARHRNVGNLGFADGSVAEESSMGLQSALLYATNGTPYVPYRLAIP